MMPIRLRHAAVVAALVLAPATLAAQGHTGHAPPMMTPAADTPPPLFTNLGSYVKVISTHVDTTQLYFNQGVRLLYGFNHMEAMLAFREAARRDPRCAICWWGVAQSYGPDINQEMNQERWDSASAAIRRARSLPSAGWESFYISAAYGRFIPTPANWSDADAVRRLRLHQDTVYADSMRAIAIRTQDADAITWYAEALLDLSPWNQWSHDGSRALPGTDTAVSALKFVVDHYPQHPGGNHLYVHALEASDHPGDATVSAERLAALMPGASHMVHMPSHVYLRTGRFVEAAQANVDAVKADSNYLFVERRLPLGRYPRYFAHNLEFLWAGAGMSGQHALSWRAATNQAGEWPADSAARYPNTQHFLTTSLVVAIRFGDWTSAGGASPPADSLRFARGVWHYAHGFAQLRMHHPDLARTDLAALQALIAISGADSVPAQSINSGRELLRLASATLAGQVLAAENDRAALDSLRRAAQIQDGLRYDEPPPFYFPVRHSLGRVLLQFDRAAEAECIYLADLKLALPATCGPVLPTPHPNPGNLWSYKGLELAYLALHRPDDARRAREAFDTAAQASELRAQITASEF